MPRKKSSDHRGFTTRAVHAADAAEAVRQRPSSTPVYQAATFAFDDMDDFAAVAQSKVSGGYLYSRWANPTTDALARTIASLEGAESSTCLASGMAAVHASLAASTQSGDHIVSSKMLYGGTFGLMNEIMVKSGVTTTFVDISDLDAVDAAFTEKTKVLYCETIGNPTMTVADIDSLAATARSHHATFIVDATFTTPYLLPVLEHGAHLSLHSATKYLGGHSDVTAGVISGDLKRIKNIRMLGLEYGAVLAPFESWLTLRGVQTLALRMDRICSNAMSLARFLASRQGVRAVHYPGLPQHPQHDLAKRLLRNGFGGMLAFEITGGRAAGRAFMERMRIASAAASLGGTKTLVVHPASVTHTQMLGAQRRAVGITDGLIRASVGIEDPEDLIADFDRALG